MSVTQVEPVSATPKLPGDHGSLRSSRSASTNKPPVVSVGGRRRSRRLTFPECCHYFDGLCRPMMSPVEYQVAMRTALGFCLYWEFRLRYRLMTLGNAGCLSLPQCATSNEPFQLLVCARFDAICVESSLAMQCCLEQLLVLRRH